MIEINGKSLNLSLVNKVASEACEVRLNREQAKKIDSIRGRLKTIIEGEKPVYGINTGFGALAETSISHENLARLQYNLIQSHAVGIGRPLEFPHARALTLLRANALASGHSGCRSVVIENMLALLNVNCAPFVPSKGSVGASGDLAPLAHLAMLLLGEGKALCDGLEILAVSALEKANIKPLVLEAKEGLSLINGTQAMAAVGCIEAKKAADLSLLADIIGACSLVALNGSKTSFDSRIHFARPHLGQIESAALIRRILGDDDHLYRNTKLQDPYSLRCMPQVHGASRDCINHVISVLEIEINSSTDNPLVFISPETDELEVLSGGNFHGQPIAFALDYLAMATAELASISERRIEQMLNPSLSMGLPPFLAPDAGLNSGFMIIHVAAASLVNENKIFCHPASTDSIPTSANREDHVSMGMTSANKLKTVVENTQIVLASELMAACQAIDLRGFQNLSPSIRKLHKLVREQVGFAAQDRAYHIDLAKIIDLVKSGAILEILF